MATLSQLRVVGEIDIKESKKKKKQKLERWWWHTWSSSRIGTLLTVQAYWVACQRLPSGALDLRAGRSGTGNRGWGLHASPHSFHSRASKCPRAETCHIPYPTTRQAIAPLWEGLSARHCGSRRQLSILNTKRRRQRSSLKIKLISKQYEEYYVSTQKRIMSQ